MDYDYLVHYGTPRHSGRYPWGSGENPQRSKDLARRIRDMRKQGMKDTEIGQALGMSTTKLRAVVSNDRIRRREDQQAQAAKLRNKGYGFTEIGRIMGINESSVRSLLDDSIGQKQHIAGTVADVLKNGVADKKFIDVGAGVEADLGISSTKLNNALAILQEQGYAVHTVYVEQATNEGKYTNIKVLAPPGTTEKEIKDHLGDIKTLSEYSPDGGETFLGVKPPVSLDSSRVKIKYAEEGGTDRDGLIEIRRGVDDISLGESRYAQVRIAVDDKSYMKGMAVYSDNVPDGYDIVFNTNKSVGTPPEKVFKDLKADPDNPFGATIKARGQMMYIGPDGKEHQGVVNKVNEEGDWSEWASKLPSQFLSKQNTSLISRQLNLTYDKYQKEFDEIQSLTNPVVKKKLLLDFADQCDSQAVYLKAEGFPNQHTQVILPIPSLKDKEIYAPNYNNGDQVALVRYPHGGIFEIPILTVNNANKDGRAMMGPDARDAVGINPKTASQLSGADFDGDTVTVIPITRSTRINSHDPFPELVNFDNKVYKKEGLEISDHTKQLEMGKVTNLITDMTLKGAPDDKIIRAVKHSMVVIDAQKHHLDYKRSEEDFGIAALKEEYQTERDENGKKIRGGAGTIISRAKSEERVPQRRMTYHIDPDTGEKTYDLKSNSTYTSVKKNSDGTITTEVKQRTQASTKMAEAKDAYTLVSKDKNPKELLYADYANKMKAMGNAARKAYMATGPIKYVAEAAATYKAEVASLKAKLNNALKNAPRERQAQIYAAEEVKAKKAANPELKEHKDQLKRLKQQALTRARLMFGASRRDVLIDFTPREWEAIQAGACHNNLVEQLLNNADTDRVRQLAMPRNTRTISPARVSRIRAMNNRNYTNAEIAQALGISTSMVQYYLNGDGKED